MRFLPRAQLRITPRIATYAVWVRYARPVDFSGGMSCDNASALRVRGVLPVNR